MAQSCFLNTVTLLHLLALVVVEFTPTLLQRTRLLLCLKTSSFTVMSPSAAETRLLVKVAAILSRSLSPDIIGPTPLATDWLSGAHWI